MSAQLKCTQAITGFILAAARYTQAAERGDPQKSFLMIKKMYILQDQKNAAEQLANDPLKPDINSYKTFNTRNNAVFNLKRFAIDLI